MTKQDVVDQITTLENQKRGTVEIMDRCEGGLQICRAFLSKFEKAEEAAKEADAQASPAPQP